MKKSTVIPLAILTSALWFASSVFGAEPTAGADAATLHAKANELAALARRGDESSASEIAPFLADERLNAAAATALVNLPGTAGRDALRESLNSLSGRNLAGAIGALGILKDAESREKLAELANSPDPLVADAAKAALNRIDRAPAPTSELPAARNDGVPSAKSVPSADAIDAALTAFLAQNSNDADENASGAAALELLCRRTNETRETVARLTARLDGDSAAELSPERRAFVVSLLAAVGTKDAIQALGNAVFSGDDVVCDAATRALGEALTLDAAPVLREIAANHPAQKYRVRAVRGFVRLARQMKDVPTERLAMLDEIAPLAERDEERQLIAELRGQTEYSRTDQPLFDGVSFAGWEGDADPTNVANPEKTFRIEDGVIVGGFAQKGLSQNEFLCSTQTYRDFTLTLELKIVGDGANAGVQFRSARVPNSSETIGFQADATADGSYSGRLYDESRRNRFLADVDEKKIAEIWKPNDWNRYKIVCWGPKIKIYLNDVLTVEYVETDPSVPLEGLIGLQIHAGGPSRAYYRNIRLENYPENVAE